MRVSCSRKKLFEKILEGENRIGNTKMKNKGGGCPGGGWKNVPCGNGDWCCPNT